MSTRVGSVCRYFTYSAAFGLVLVVGSACSSKSDDSQGTTNTDAGGSNSGGASATTVASNGGHTSTGGSPSNATGGSSSGGVNATGGASTGGAPNTGGVPGTGGVTGKGGASNSGGANAIGGTPNQGGATNTGGAPNVGGKTNSGGATGPGGASTGGSVTTGGRASGGASGNANTGGRQSGGTSGASVGGGSSATGGAGTGFMPCPTTAGTACNVMPVGDSITEGCCTAPMGGYRIELFRQSLTNKKNITFVGTLSNGPNTVDGTTFPKKHEGHGGWKIAQIAGVIDNAIKSSSPHIVLLKIGTNDINGNDDVANAPNRLASLIDQITKDAPSALLVVSAIIPTTNDGTNTRVQAYNTAIKAKAEAAAAAGKHVVWIDNYQAFAQNTSYKTALMADGLHPNDAGYVVLGKSFYGVIASVLPAAQ